MRGEGVAVWARCTDLIGAPRTSISHRVFLKSFGKSQIPHKSFNHIWIIVKAKLTDLWSN